MFGQVLVMRFFRDHDILTQMCGNNFLVLKAAPPLVATTAHLDKFVAALRDVVHRAHHDLGFWTEALGLARRAVNI
jgi:ornithine--oxo-acid transaminase